MSQKSSKIQINDIVLVSWEDAWHSSSNTCWTKDEIDREGPCKINSVGIVVRNDSTGIYMASETVPGDDWRYTNHIPKAMIRSIKVLGRKDVN